MSRRTFAARRHHVLSSAERLERHRRNLANLRGANVSGLPRRSTSAEVGRVGVSPAGEGVSRSRTSSSPVEIMQALKSPTQPELFS